MVKLDIDEGLDHNWISWVASAGIGRVVFIIKFLIRIAKVLGHQDA